MLIAAVAALWLATAGPAESPAIRIGRFPLEQFLVNVGVSCLAVILAYVGLGRRSWKRRASSAGGGVLLLLAVWLLVELPAVLGWVDYGVTLFGRRIGGDGPNPMQLDAELLFRHRPYDRFTTTQPWDATVDDLAPGESYRIEYRYDNRGFRNARDYQQAPVVLVGDSFVEGYLVPHDLICATRLSDMLGVDVCNLGQNDYGPAQELVVLRRYALPLHPRVIAWFFFEENDLFDLEDYGLMTRGWRRYFVRPDSIVSRSFCFNALHRLGRSVERFRWRDPEADRKLPVKLRPEIPGGQLTMSFSSAPYELPPDRRERLLAGTGELLAEAGAMCRAEGIRFLVVFAPESFRVYRQLCVIEEGSPLAKRQSSDLPERIGRLCEAEGIAYLDLTGALESAAGEGRLVYIPGDVHWSRQGNAVAAEEIARFITEAGWLNSPAKEEE